ncbi:hypothetical protein M0R45_008590 [Rubus argutus]|uniref:C2H2-type domain-containing protein n=1 Tax=Rubus argutus TaxID=59490 RepID=A0AAW1Y1S5_RUBAR
MGLLGLLEFSLKCFDVLAWPLAALVYPLYSSIRAIETNSITDTHKLNTYWIVFSLILLFEHASMKLLEWFPLWLHIRLLIVFWLVIPHFDGAFYVYKHLICPCLSMDLQNVITWFNNQKESFMRENFLSEVESYVKDNGPEALEKIVAGKSTESNLDVKELNVISPMDDKASTSIKPNGGHKDIKVVHVMARKKETTASQGNLTGTEDRFSAMKINEKPVEVAADREILEIPPPKKVQIGEWICTVPTLTDTTFISPVGVNKHKAVYEALKLKNETEPNLTQTESSTFAAMETKEKPIEVAMGREDLEFPPEKVQKEWTCALCQVTTTCKKSLNSHLEGSKHKAAYDALKVRNQAFLPKMAPASTTKTSDQPNKEPVNSTPSSESKIKVDINENVGGQKNSSPSSEELAEGVSSNVEKGKIDVNVEEKIQSQQEKPNEVPMMNSFLRCKTCGVRCRNEIAMLSHLNGKKHRKNVQQETPNDVARRSMRRRNHRSPDIGEPVAVSGDGWDGWYPAPAPEPVAVSQDGWYSAPAPPVAARILKGGAPVFPGGWAPEPVAVSQDGWYSAPAPPVAARILKGGAPVFPGGWAPEPVAAWQDGWHSAPVPPVAARILEGGAPVFPGGWALEPVAAWQDGWHSAAAPPVAAPILEGGAPIVPSGWD